MGKFKSCTVSFKQAKTVYREGELVGGVVMMEVTEKVEVNGVRVYCYGQALTKWSKDFSRALDNDQIGSETYFNQVFTVFGRKVGEAGPNKTLEAGKHRWAFLFRLPANNLPSSVEGQYGAIRWWLKIEVDKPFPSINNKWYRAFTVLGMLDTNEAVYKPPQKKTVKKTVSKALGLGNAGTLTLMAQTDHFGYCPGESIILTVEVKNESGKDMGRVSVTLVQLVTFTANNETKSTNQGVSSVQTKELLAKGTTMTLTDIQLPIPAVPPSTRKRTCHILCCTYTVKVSVQVPWGIDLEAVIPVAIGTIPRGKRVPPPRQSQDQGGSSSGSRPSTQIEYVRCEVGITPCTKSNNTFENFPFTPSTAFVRNVTPTAQPLSQQQQQQQQQQEARKDSASPANASPQAAATAKAREQASSEVSPSAPVMVAGHTGTVALPAYSPSLAASSGEEMEAPSFPPTYEEVVRMDEEKSQASAQASAADEQKPKGKNCWAMLVRFPDSALVSFRLTIQRDQNDLSDNGQAFLAALSARSPISGIGKPNEEWPEHFALALLIFSDAASGEEWAQGVSERGDVWYSSCDMVMLPASWTVPRDSRDRLVFTVSAITTKEDASKEKITALGKTVLPLFAKLRQETGGVKQALSKKTTLRGQWASSGHSFSIIHWPKFSNFMSYHLSCENDKYLDLSKQVQELFDIQTTLIVSEDVSSLSTQHATTPSEDDEGANVYDDDDDEDDDDVEYLEAVDENAQGLLTPGNPEPEPSCSAK